MINLGLHGCVHETFTRWLLIIGHINIRETAWTVVTENRRGRGAFSRVATQQTWEVGQALVYCWANVIDGGPTINQRNWASVSCLLGSSRTLHFGNPKLVLLFCLYAEIVCWCWIVGARRARQPVVPSRNPISNLFSVLYQPVRWLKKKSNMITRWSSFVNFIVYH